MAAELRTDETTMRSELRVGATELRLRDGGGLGF